MKPPATADVPPRNQELFNLRLPQLDVPYPFPLQPAHTAVVVGRDGGVTGDADTPRGDRTCARRSAEEAKQRLQQPRS